MRIDSFKGLFGLITISKQTDWEGGEGGCLGHNCGFVVKHCNHFDSLNCIFDTSGLYSLT